MKEIASLIERAGKYLRSADMLLQASDYESAVSMFYAAEAALLTENLPFSSHKGVLSAFGEHFIATNIFEQAMGPGPEQGIREKAVGRLRVHVCDIGR